MCGLGVAFSTRPAIGTSPISSLPYVLTLFAPLSFGVWTVIVNILFLLGQIIILRGNFRWLQLSQLGAVCVLGFFIDFGMWLSQFCIPHTYFMRLVEIFIGCIIMAAGISCELAADITYIPGEGLVKAIAAHWRLNFGKVKVFFDVSLVLIAFCISLYGSGKVYGIREGTVIAALSVGYLVRLWQKPFRVVKRSLIKTVK